MTSKKTLQLTKQQYKKHAAISYPDFMTISPGWQNQANIMRKDIPEFKTPIEAIVAAQSRYGLNHRLPLSEAICHQITVTLGQLWAEFDDIPDVFDSEYSNMCTVDRHGHSNIFVNWHLYFWLRCNQQFKKPKTILEIGSGLGELGRIFRILYPDIKYTMVDIPEVLFFADNFLRMNFDKTTGFDLVPVQSIESLYGLEYDLVINTGSFQEMTRGMLNYYMKFIQEKIQTKHFYSVNYRHNVIDRVEVLELDKLWNPVFELVNPPVVNHHPARNIRFTSEWLEILVERMDK